MTTPSADTPRYNVLVLGVKVPFTSGGQEILVRSLLKELTKRGHQADLVELPFNIPEKSSLLEQAAIWRSIDLSSFAGVDIDLVIATKFPSYYAKHPKKSLWLVHQQRPIYDLYASRYSDFGDDPQDEVIRQMLVEGDNKAFAECDFISGISHNVVARLEKYNGVPGTTLYPPLPLGGQYRQEPHENYILSVGRICGIKRVDLMVKALPMVHEFVKLKIVGQPDEPGIMDYLQNEIAKHHLSHRVEFLGRVTDKDLLSLYAKSLAVYYAPFNEDYGYVTLEAMASGKPVLTGNDSGGVLEFVTNESNGLVVEPTLDGISRGFNRMIEDHELRERMGARAKAQIEEWGLNDPSRWDHVIDSLLSPLTKIAPARKTGS